MKIVLIDNVVTAMKFSTNFNSAIPFIITNDSTTYAFDSFPTRHFFNGHLMRDAGLLSLRHLLGATQIG